VPWSRELPAFVPDSVATALLLKSNPNCTTSSPFGAGRTLSSVLRLPTTGQRRRLEIKAAMLLNNGALDDRVTGKISAWEEALIANRANHEGRVYKGTSHDFHNDTIPWV